MYSLNPPGSLALTPLPWKFSHSKDWPRRQKKHAPHCKSKSSFVEHAIDLSRTAHRYARIGDDTVTFGEASHVLPESSYFTHNLMSRD